MHFCIEQRNMSRFACCQFVLLINDSSRLPFCTEDILANSTTTQSRYEIITHPNASFPDGDSSLSTPVYLSLPAEVPADHVTFMFGIIILMSIAVCCTFLMSKMAKPRLAHISVGGINYDLLMWLSSNHERRSSLLFFLRELACRRNRTRDTSLSVISSASLNALPSYRSATTTTSPTSIPPPPAYEELQQLTLDSPYEQSLRENDLDDNNNN
uniref:Conserved plasma membrane protein n=1 Tax=Steinernema glaseri TaxID=37863 RepID=A0A1I8APC9_9BILA